MRTSRGLAMVCLVLAVAAGVAVASFTVSTNAAVVNGAAISRATLNSDLSTISKNPTLQCFLLADAYSPKPLPSPGGSSVSGAGVMSGALPGSANTAVTLSIPDPATYSSAFTAYWLNELITGTLLDQRLAAEGVAVTPYALARARDLLSFEASESVNLLQQAAQNGAKLPPQCPTSTQAVLNAVPPSFLDRMVAVRAALEDYELSSVGESLTPASVARYYDAHRSAFDSVCVAVLPVPASTTVQQVQQALAGNSFAALAQANGGSGRVCLEPGLSSLAQVAAGLPIGQLDGPLPYSNADNLFIERVSTATQPLSQVESKVAQAMLAALGNAGSKQVAKLQRDSHIWVDPRYGRWVPTPVFSVETWAGPGAQNLLCPQANVTVEPGLYRCPPTPATGATTVNLRPAPTTQRSRSG